VENVEVRHGDGYRGWKEEAPFDAILITAAAPKIPRPLVDQLRVGGKLVMPLGEKPQGQELIVLTKTEQGLEKDFITGVVFVPMTGEVRE
jgi:protein-L-isoaspartate(D-aspartate) O-methyltransferase